MNCPKCNAPMSRICVDSDELAVCDTCHTTREINPPGNLLGTVMVILMAVALIVALVLLAVYG